MHSAGKKGSTIVLAIPMQSFFTLPFTQLHVSPGTTSPAPRTNASVTGPEVLQPHWQITRALPRALDKPRQLRGGRRSPSAAVNLHLDTREPCMMQHPAIPTRFVRITRTPSRKSRNPDPGARCYAKQPDGSQGYN